MSKSGKQTIPNTPRKMHRSARISPVDDSVSRNLYNDFQNTENFLDGVADDQVNNELSDSLSNGKSKGKRLSEDNDSVYCTQIQKKHFTENGQVLNEDDLRRNGLIYNSADRMMFKKFTFVPYVYDVHFKVQVAFLLCIEHTPYKLLKIDETIDPIFTPDFIERLKAEKYKLDDENDLMMGSSLPLLHVSNLKFNHNDTAPEQTEFIITYYVKDSDKSVKIHYNMNEYHEIMKFDLWNSIYESAYKFDCGEFKRTKIVTMMGCDKRVFVFPHGTDESKNIKHEQKYLQQPEVKKQSTISLGRTNLYNISGTTVRSENTNISSGKYIIFGTFTRTEQEDMSKKDNESYVKKKNDVKRIYGFNSLMNWTPLCRKPNNEEISFRDDKIELRFMTEQYPKRKVINSRKKIDPKELKGQVVAIVVNNMTPYSYSVKNTVYPRVHGMAAYAIDVIQLPKHFQTFWNDFVVESHEINRAIKDDEKGAVNDDDDDDDY